jgi:hypothetical protein
LYLKHPCKTMVIRSSLPETIYTYTIGFPCGWDQGVLSLWYQNFDELFPKISVVVLPVIYWVPFFPAHNAQIPQSSCKWSTTQVLSSLHHNGSLGRGC